MYGIKSLGEDVFDTSANQPGLHIWRIEKMKPVPVPAESWGTFYTGDSYLVLHNVLDGQSDLHMWLGDKSTRDECGSCAVYATKLDKHLGSRPIQQRQTQGNESEDFMNLFPQGVKYKEGGVDSGFHKVGEKSTAALIRKLYHIKGKKSIRAREVELSWSSVNKGDCFVLDAGEVLFVWCGSNSNMFERSKAMEVANAIRDMERKGKAAVKKVNDGEELVEMLQILGAKPSLPEESPEDDKEADRSHGKEVVLYKISDATGSMKRTKISSDNPFGRELLVTDDCFILDCGQCGKIFIWKGRKANEDEKRAALQVAEGFITEMNYPPKTQVEILLEGKETVMFKQFFKSWN
ncbi:macrophage-capping protein [Latimeria chalumnae]|uniref:macrophage-capping protein n=1 Tax=Latimeria chalumnae TaxID=7897 RepID=UPI0003C11CA2|nr:PREDICTED: macrophage-capping protein [Latimeria chalumnae]|eukprot:XP_006010370.1 PREDICTED: macrophage-capping protein [Latimeria chalumnae]